MVILESAAASVLISLAHSIQGDNPDGLVDALEPFLRECFG